MPGWRSQRPRGERREASGELRLARTGPQPLGHLERSPEGEEVGSCGRLFPGVGLVDVGGRVVVYRKFSGGQRPAETTMAMSKELSPSFSQVREC